MCNLIKPYDLGKNSLVAENCHKIKVDSLVVQAKKDLKQRLLEAQVDALGVKIGLTTSKTRFGGERLWFVCPTCDRRVGVVYLHPLNQKIACRQCLGLKYSKQRFRGMIEDIANRNY